MPLSPEQLDKWFYYHAPTEETAPKHAAIRDAEDECRVELRGAWDGPCDARAFGKINAATRAFAEAIDAHAPDSADKSAAIRCVRLARNAANEAMQMLLSTGGSGFDAPLESQAFDQLRAARWQANSAIACGGK